MAIGLCRFPSPLPLHDSSLGELGGRNFFPSDERLMLCVLPHHSRSSAQYDNWYTESYENSMRKFGRLVCLAAASQLVDSLQARLEPLVLTLFSFRSYGALTCYDMHSNAHGAQRKRVQMRVPLLLPPTQLKW
jgi:hypothetical protein